MDTLNALSTSTSYSSIATQQRDFLVNACHEALSATRASQADLHQISQALQTSVGRGTTAPHLVLPADSAYHFTSGTPSPTLNQQDVNYGYALSLWDTGAYTARFTSTGSSSTTNYMSQATQRLEQLINGEVCEDSGVKPATRYIVRKVFTGKALQTLLAKGAFDFEVTLDDIAASGKDGSNPTRGVVAQNLSTRNYDVKLDGGFVVSAGYSVCNGTTPGAECKTRVPASSLGNAAAGGLNAVYLANRGEGSVPSAQLAGGGCAANQALLTTSSPIKLGTSSVAVSACTTGVLTPRLSASLLYFDTASAPDSQVLNREMQSAQCNVDASVQASRPLQGLPVLGTWALASSAANAAQLNASMAAAPISVDTLPVPAGATGIEVLFLVGAEPVEPNDDGAFTLAAAAQ